jgi:eukaryotic-like serine/threonine-protein kinase
VSSLIGRTLSHYQIVDEISRGGMGVVYRAIDVRLNREVALKVLPPELVADQGRRTRFVQEAQAASALEHPHIAVIHEIDEADGISFIAMELVRGEKLSDLIARGALPAARSLDLAAQVAEGLARAHDKGILHRDLKPANVMLTDDGHAKIIDFGLAKLVEPVGGDSNQHTVLKAETDPGMVVGTVSYMSPEQARGARVDHRSDIFSLGVLLHEMLTGRPPFRGGTGIDTMHAILHDTVPALPRLGGAVSDEATREVQRLLDKCLAKEPDERYQGMRDVAVDLRAARRRLESSSATSGAAIARMTTTEGLMRARLWVFAAMGVFVLALIAFNQWRPRQTAPAAATDKPSVAVLYFENNTGNPQLDWLRTGLTDMMVTDLSQSPDVEVLGTDRLVQILTSMKRQDDRVVSFDTVQEIAKRAGVKSVLLGSYMKSGDTIRINIKLQEATTGRILTSERVEAMGESNLFPTVDDLTRRIRAKFSIPRAVDPTKGLLVSPAASTTARSTFDRDLIEVTTTSIEAYRYYAEGINLHERGREQEALSPLEKAVEIDPGFAMALGKLAIVYGNLLQMNHSAEYAERALEHVDRLTPRERYYIEGLYYFRKSETVKAIDAYKKVIELYPDHASSRHNLASIYDDLERYQESIPLYEELRRRGMTFPSTHGNLARSYAALGNFEQGNDVLQEFVRRNPDSAGGYRNLTELLMAWGKLDDATTANARATALEPANPFLEAERFELFVLRERWVDADSAARKLSQSNSPFFKWLANVAHAELALYKGDANAALRWLDAAVAGEGPKGSLFAAVSRVEAGGVLLDKGQPGLALAEGRRAFQDAGNDDTGLDGLALTAVAHGRLGRAEEAKSAIEELTRIANAIPSDRGKRRVHHVAGRLALDRKDLNAAIRELKLAETMLPVSNVPGPPPPHVPIWFDLGTALWQNGNAEEASVRFQRIADSTTLRTPYALAFVRSLYFLGEISERRGDRAKARAYYQRFVDYWGDGDIDKERVAHARTVLARPT